MSPGLIFEFDISFLRVLKIAALLARPSANKSAYCVVDVCANHGSNAEAIINHRRFA